MPPPDEPEESYGDPDEEAAAPLDDNSFPTLEATATCTDESANKHNIADGETWHQWAYRVWELCNDFPYKNPVDQVGIIIYK